VAEARKKDGRRQADSWIYDGTSWATADLIGDRSQGKSRASVHALRWRWMRRRRRRRRRRS
jgi:hypothetical protein